MTAAAALPPNATIGIVGGGQLGRMSALAAARLGYRCHILTPEHDSPAAQVSASVTIGDFEDPAALRAFAASVDVITFEFENVSAAGLDLLASLRPVRPSPAILRISQDRVAEKSFVNAAGIGTAPWRAVGSPQELDAAIADLGYPAILKTTRLGYDGKGQAMLREPVDLAPAYAALEPKPLILEGFVDFAREISVVVARGEDGTLSSFDTVENSHRDHILDMTLAPARITDIAAAQAREIARRVAGRLDLIGLLAVEMFVAADGRVLVNEIAPRPHNSGHWTIDACPASQFEMHIRAIAGLPLPAASRHSDAVMKNLVGPEETALWPEILASPGLIPHLYGKADARAGRKMGHVTRLFGKGALPGAFGIAAALGPLASNGEGFTVADHNTDTIAGDDHGQRQRYRRDHTMATLAGAALMQDTRTPEILDIVAKETGVPRDRLLPDASIEELGIASLDMVQTIFAIESRYDVEIPVVADRVGAEFTTVGNLLSHVLRTLDRMQPEHG